MSINDEAQIEATSSNGSVPTTIKPFDGRDSGYTVVEYLNCIIAAMTFSSGIEPVNRPGHHQWKIKRAAVILHTLQGPAQKWYQPYQAKQNSIGIYSIKISLMFDTEKSKQQAKTVLQQIQKHTNDSLTCLELRIETLVKTACTIYADDYKNSINKHRKNQKCHLKHY